MLVRRIFRYLEMGYKLCRSQFQVDTFEKAKTILDALSYSRMAHEKLSYMFEQYPELAQCTHQHIGDVMVLERETVTRALGKLRNQNNY